MRSLVILRWLAVLAIVFAAGCASLSKSRDTFPEVTRDVTTSLRWGDYSGVARYMTPEHRAAFLKQTDDDADLNIVDVRLDSTDEGARKQRARTCLAVDYYRLPSTVVKTERFCLDWTYLGKHGEVPGGWQIRSPIPPFP